MDPLSLIGIIFGQYQTYVAIGALSIFLYRINNELKLTRAALQVVNHNSTVMLHALIRKGFVDPKEIEDIPI